MSWTEIQATATELGKTFVVAHPAFVLGLYGDSRLNVHGEALLDWWLGLLPPKTPLWYLSGTAHHFREVTPRPLSRIRATLRGLEQKGQFYMLKDAPEFTASQHSLEMGLGAKPGATSANTAYMALPVDYPDKVGPDAAVAMFRQLVERIPFRHGAAGYGFDVVWGREWEMAAMPVIMAAARRFLALDVRDRILEGTLVNQLKGPGWLTYLEADLFDQLGGQAALEQSLSEGVTAIPTANGIILRAGERPPVGDKNRRAEDLGPLRQVSRFLKPIRKEKWISTNLFRIDPAAANAWFSRLEE